MCTYADGVLIISQVRCKLGIPAPKVLAWHSRADDSPIGAAYIIMEKAQGVPLTELWESMSLRQRSGLIQNFDIVQKALSSISFKSYGSLYFAQDVKAGPPAEPLYINTAGNDVVDERYIVGPIIGRGWLDDGRAKIKFDRGPCKFIEFQM